MGKMSLAGILMLAMVLLLAWPAGNGANHAAATDAADAPAASDVSAATADVVAVDVAVASVAADAADASAASAVSAALADVVAADDARSQRWEGNRISTMNYMSRKQMEDILQWEQEGRWKAYNYPTVYDAAQKGMPVMDSSGRSELPAMRLEGEVPLIYPLGEGTAGGSRAVQEASPGKEIRCLVLPHHYPAAGLSVHALRQVAAQDRLPELVVVLGPNHANIGEPAMTTDAAWATPFGTVLPRMAGIHALSGTGLVEVSSRVFEEEHSMGMVIPWVAHFLPDAEVVPLLLHYRYPLPELEKLLESLAAHAAGEKEMLLIVSADFSHHHTRDEAEALDRLTAAYLAEGNWRAISRLSSEYLDSPTLVAAMMRFAESRGYQGPAVMAHTNAGFLTGDAYSETASYFVLAYGE